MTLPTEAADRHVSVGPLDVHYWELGDGRPVVLLHGGLATAEMSWATAMPVLARAHRVIAPDTRGHGRTANPADRLAYDQLADDVVDLVDALGLDRPFVFGHSDGAQIALELGLRHPGRAAGLVLSGTMSEPTPGYVEGLHEWGFTGPGTVDLDRIAAEFGDDHEPTRLAHEHAGRPDRWPGFLAQIAELWLTLPAYSDERLGTISDPTLVITGDRDELADLTQAERLYRAIQAAELAIVPNGGHGAADLPVFWSLVLDFLARHGSVA
jgi:pimeloyl-ACP methyl ester carboxylesterase